MVLGRALNLSALGKRYKKISKRKYPYYFPSLKSTQVKTITAEDRSRKGRWAWKHEDEAVRVGVWAGISIGQFPRKPER